VRRGFYNPRNAPATADWYGVEIDPGYLAVTLERLSMLGLKPELMQ
jgi:hypothetical protein